MKHSWLLVLVCFVQSLFAGDVSVAVSPNKTIQKVSFTLGRGIYVVKSGANSDTLTNEFSLEVKPFKGGVLYNLNSQKWMSSVSLEIYGIDYVNHLNVSVLGEVKKYDGGFVISKNESNGGLLLINIVDLDHYVAGVVEAEAGYRLPIEYYKLQAILCRTYALKNNGRHGAQGFDLCDDVHCQVYRNKCTKQDIIRATAATSNLVVVDNNLQLINTTFHSNCGGQTRNSEDVWIEKLSYLRSVKDTFCLHEPHSRWRVCFKKEDLDEYLGSKGVNDSLSLSNIFGFCQDSVRFAQKKLEQIRLTQMRRDLKLRSTFFSVEDQGDTIYLYGKGFGHGVGLCQEGGINMARKGYSYVDILKYYYSDIHIVNLKALTFFRD